jgi:hypothetical protein
MAELLLLFKDPHNTRRPWPHHPSFRRASLRSPSSKTGGAAREIPVLLTTKLVLFCSPRDRTRQETGLWLYDYFLLVLPHWSCILQGALKRADLFVYELQAC